MDDNYKIKPPSIFFRKMKAYVKSYHGETKWIFFWLKMMKYLKKKHNDVWNKVSNSIKKIAYWQ